MLFDLTHTIKPDMPVFPGTAAPVLSQANTLEEHGFRETGLSMTSHTGTHMDAPFHLLPQGRRLDQRAVDPFWGKAAVVDCAALGGGNTITADFLQRQDDLLRQADFVLLRTGHEALWGQPGFFSGFAVPDADAARYLAALGLKGVGTDAISVDTVEDETLPNHRILLGAGLLSIENLCLSQLAEGELYEFFALPLKFEIADGAPVRAVARL